MKHAVAGAALVAAIAVSSLAPSGTLEAQQPTRPDSSMQQGGRRDPTGPRRGGGPNERVTPADRAAMEQRIDAQINEILRTKLRLTDDQFTQLRAVSTRVEREKRELWRDEQTVRTELRRQLLATEPASEARIAELLDQLPRIERRRIDSVEQEQRELSKFLSPSQRARYFSLQDELRRGMQEMQRGRLGMPGPGMQGPGGPGKSGDKAPPAGTRGGGALR